MPVTMPKIIQNAECLPSGVMAIHAACNASPLSQEELRTVMTAHLAGKTDVFSPVLEAALYYELIEDKGKTLKVRVDPVEVVRTLRRGIIADDADFRAAAGYFLSRTPWEVTEKSFDDWQKTPLGTWVKNSVPWRNFSRWMEFLGFATVRGSRMLPDPTQAVLDVLDEVIPSGLSVSAADLIDRLECHIPLPASTGEHDICSALSLTLKGLSLVEIKLDTLSDTSKFKLVLPEGPEYFTHAERRNP